MISNRLGGAEEQFQVPSSGIPSPPVRALSPGWMDCAFCWLSFLACPWCGVCRSDANSVQNRSKKCIQFSSPAGSGLLPVHSVQFGVQWPSASVQFFQFGSRTRNSSGPGGPPGRGPPTSGGGSRGRGGEESRHNVSLLFIFVGLKSRWSVQTVAGHFLLD